MAEKKSMREDLEDIGKTYADSARGLGRVASDLGSRAAGKAKEFGAGVAKEARNYGRLYKEGLGMKPETPYEMKKGGSTKKWIQSAIKKPGALRSQLGAKEGKPIQTKKLAAAAKKPGKLGQRARLAQTLKGLKK